MFGSRDRRIPRVTSPLNDLLDSVYLTVTFPTWPWGYLRLGGLALMLEGVFLVYVSASVPVGGLATLSLVVGEVAVAVSLAGSSEAV